MKNSEDELIELGSEEIDIVSGGAVIRPIPAYKLIWWLYRKLR